MSGDRRSRQLALAERWCALRGEMISLAYACIDHPERWPRLARNTGRMRALLVRMEAERWPIEGSLDGLRWAYPRKARSDCERARRRLPAGTTLAHLLRPRST